jgi:glycosyltransferase involved in cell wall biosynthesis
VFDAHEAFSQYARLREHPAGRLLGRFERFMARHADGVITVNQMMGDFFSGLRGRPVVVANNYPGADAVAHLLEVPSRDREGGPHRNADLVVGYIGSLGLGTRIDLIVDAIRRLDTRPGAPRVDLYLVGPVSPAWEPDLDELLSTLPARRTTKVGEVPYDEVPGHYRHIDATVIAEDPGGNNERATSVKLFESMAAARPVVIRPIGDMPEILHSSQSGLVVRTGDPDELADALAELAADPAKREALGRSGREAVVATYSWEPEAAKIEALYRKLTHRSD